MLVRPGDLMVPWLQGSVNRTVTRVGDHVAVLGSWPRGSIGLVIGDERHLGYELLVVVLDGRVVEVQRAAARLLHRGSAGDPK